MPGPRTAALVAGTGALALTAAGVVLLTSPLLLKAPLAQHRSLHATGAATFLDTTSGAPRPGTLVQLSTISTHQVGGVAAGSSTVASYDQTDTSSFVSGGTTRELATTTVTYAFDRSTGAGRPGVHGDTLGTSAHLYKLPFHTQQRDYTTWDATTKRAVPLVYAGQTTISGLPVYVFRRDAAPTDLGLLPVFKAIPGSWVGHPEVSSIPAHEWYENTDSTVYVEPVTGALVGGASSPHLWAQTTGALGGLRIDLLRVDHAAPVPKDAARLVRDAKDARAKVLQLQRAPKALGALGLALLLAAAALARRRRPGTSPTVLLPVPRDPEDAASSGVTA